MNKTGNFVCLLSEALNRQGTGNSGTKKSVKTLGVFNIKTAPVWELTPSMYLSQQNIHEPWIAEIAPSQYARLSKRGKAEYDRKRSAEWEASAKGKSAWADKVFQAYKDGKFSLDDPNVTKEAKDHIFFALRELEKLDRAEALSKFRAQNTIKSFDQLKVGDRVWSIMSRDYYTVIKVNPKSVRIASEQLYKPYGRGEPEPILYNAKFPNELKRLSPADEEAGFEMFYRPVARQTYEKPSKRTPEQLTLFGLRRLRRAIL